MMKKTIKMALILPLVVSLCCGNMYAGRKNNNHDGFVIGAFAVGAALLGAAGAVALWDAITAETEDQLITRIDNEYRSLFAAYKQTIDYFSARAGVGVHAPHRPLQAIPEAALFEFATYLWNQNSTHYDYRSGVRTAKHTLQSCVKDLRKRINYLENKHLTYEERQKLSSLRYLLSNVEMLLADVALFSDCLECHKTYLHLYETVGNIHGRYMHAIDIIISDRYSVAAELKNYILSSNNGQYPFRTFIKSLEHDISTVQSTISSLAYHYESGRNSAHVLLNRLVMIKNIIISDPLYQEELYQWEQARLERQRIAALEDQARLERERIRVLQQQNRILKERTRLERDKYENCWPRPRGAATPVIEEVSVTVSF